MMMLIDTASAAPEFLAFFHAEELDCGELGPLVTAPLATDASTSAP
jgi:hypothetical protein